MKLLRSCICFLTICVLSISMTTCKKDDQEERKEALIRTLVQNINADSIGKNVIWLQDMGTRFSLADNTRNVAIQIKEKFKSYGYADAALDSFWIESTFRDVMYEQIQYNVIASIEGSDYPDSVCVVGGHYDNIIKNEDLTIVPGANDNASGTAAVLEIARVMKKTNFRSESTIMFIAFGAEELGLLGSKNFASDPNGFSEKIRFMLNSDMIAYETSADAGNWYVNIMDYDNSHSLRQDAEAVGYKYTVLSFTNDNTYNKQSDSYPFFTNGYKALFFISGDADPNYHTLNDLASSCNFEYCAEIVKLQCALVADKN